MHEPFPAGHFAASLLFAAAALCANRSARKFIRTTSKLWSDTRVKLFKYGKFQCLACGQSKSSSSVGSKQ